MPLNSRNQNWLLARAKNVINCIWVLMNEFDCLHGHLPGFKRVICIGTKFTSISLTIAVTDGVAMAAHFHIIQVIINTCSGTSTIAMIFLISERINKKREGLIPYRMV